MPAESPVVGLYSPKPELQLHISDLEDASLPGFLILAVFDGLHLSLKVAQPVDQKLFIQLVVVSLLAYKQKLLILSRYLDRFIVV